MAEWPKRAMALTILTDEPPPHEVIEVIPADLGRELYEALKEGALWKKDSRQKQALARYEREVGDDWNQRPS